METGVYIRQLYIIYYGKNENVKTSFACSQRCGMSVAKGSYVTHDKGQDYYLMCEFCLTHEYFFSFTFP